MASKTWMLSQEPVEVEDVETARSVLVRLETGEGEGGEDIS